MNARETVYAVSAGALLAMSAPAFAERDGPRPYRNFDRYERDHAFEQRWDPLESTCRHASLSIL